ncbi:APC membrane recruitment protein 2-like [Oncorhynchus tshawytscha]|uniref:APC membrane recruitment protein 2-like n=1 Tax=Oncorhynchus tshawytscha TaxID=74940 RepID=UPI001C3E55C5|nr:APC membrane recruitment protein 2-like [Oncorhynchus tshawytscha]
MDVQSESSEPSPCDPQPPGKIRKAFKLFGKRKPGSIFSIRGKGEGNNKSPIARSKTVDGLKESVAAESELEKDKEPEKEQEPEVSQREEQEPEEEPLGDDGNPPIPSAELPSITSAKSFSFLMKLQRSRQGGVDRRFRTESQPTIRQRRGLKGLFGSMGWNQREEASDEADTPPSPLLMSSCTNSMEIIKEDMTLTPRPAPHSLDVPEPESGQGSPVSSKSPTVQESSASIPPETTALSAATYSVTGSNEDVASPLPTIEPPPLDPAVDRLRSLLADISSLISFDSLSGCGDITAEVEADGNLIPTSCSNGNLIPTSSTCSNIIPTSCSSGNLIPTSTPCSNLIPTSCSSGNLITTSCSSSNLIPTCSSSNLIPTCSSSNLIPTCSSSNLIQAISSDSKAPPAPTPTPIPMSKTPLFPTPAPTTTPVPMSKTTPVSAPAPVPSSMPSPVLTPLPLQDTPLASAQVKGCERKASLNRGEDMTSPNGMDVRGAWKNSPKREEKRHVTQNEIHMVPQGPPTEKKTRPVRAAGLSKIPVCGGGRTGKLPLHESQPTDHKGCWDPPITGLEEGSQRPSLRLEVSKDTISNSSAEAEVEASLSPVKHSPEESRQLRQPTVYRGIPRDSKIPVKLGVQCNIPVSQGAKELPRSKIPLSKVPVRRIGNKLTATTAASTQIRK